MTSVGSLVRKKGQPYVRCSVSCEIGNRRKGRRKSKYLVGDFQDIPFDQNPNYVYIGRACFRGGWKLKATIWRNTLKGKEFTFKNYKKLLKQRGVTKNQLLELEGKILCCWCFGKREGGQGCHGFFLKRLVDRVVDDQRRKEENKTSEGTGK